jgi:hypothetical protein
MSVMMVAARVVTISLRRFAARFGLLRSSPDPRSWFELLI